LTLNSTAYSTFCSVRSVFDVTKPCAGSLQGYNDNHVKEYDACDGSFQGDK
jgi:hypothetical protein